MFQGEFNMDVKDQKSGSEFFLQGQIRIPNICIRIRNSGTVGSVARGLMEGVELKEWIGLRSIKTCLERASQRIAEVNKIRYKKYGWRKIRIQAW